MFLIYVFLLFWSNPLPVTEVIVPEMIGSVVGVYNGKTFINVEVKPEMIGHYLAEFSISYSPVASSHLTAFTIDDSLHEIVQV